MNEWQRKIVVVILMVQNWIRDALDYVSVVVGYFYGKMSAKRLKLTPLDPIEQLSPYVCRILGQNPGSFTLQGTNTYLVGATERKILIDCGDFGIQKYTRNLKDALGNNKIVLIVCTHWHDDHVGGIVDIFQHVTNGPVPVYKFERTDAPETTGNVKYDYISPGHIIKAPGITLRCLATPGHTSDHMSLYFDEEQSLFSGDCILGEGTTIFEDLYDYMHSLEKLSELNVTRIYPGHGPVVEKGAEKILEYIMHRKKREDQILKAMENLTLASSIQITNIVYKDVPWTVKLGAVNNVNNHLSKLVKEGRIERIAFDNYRLKDTQKAVLKQTPVREDLK